MAITLNEKLLEDLKQLLIEYPALQILSSSARSMEDQMYYVVTRWDGYPTVKKEFMDKFKIKEDELPTTTASLNTERSEYLKSRIQHHADKGNGFKHLQGNAIDINVGTITDWKIKETIKQKIEKLRYTIILEKPPKYYVSIEEATTFHVELKK